MRQFFDWFDSRTGYRKARDEALLEPIPGGSRWAYVWGSTLVYTFVVQMITGIFLWAAYSPSVGSAWESVYYIQNMMTWGAYVRGIHHFAAQAMIVLLLFHFLQILWHKAYLAPREINYWLGLVLMLIVFGLGLTGYLLPWDQKGYYATKVATNIMSNTPVIGPALKVVVQGGGEYGHHTLTRFFALHVGILPGALVAVLALHIMVFRRHGITVPDPHRRPEGKFWPDQILKDALACAAVLGVLLGLTFFVGAELSAPADPAESYSAARPEWYFLFLFRFLKIGVVDYYGVAFGAIYIPTVVMGFLFAMPLIGMLQRGSGGTKIAGVLWLLLMAGFGALVWTFVPPADPAHPIHFFGQTVTPKVALTATVLVPLTLVGFLFFRSGHAFNVGFVTYLVIGAAALTGIAFYEDANSESHQLAAERAHADAERIRELASGPDGIPPAGAVMLLRNDPLTQGPRIFARNCSACHAYDGHNGLGSTIETAYASDLGNFGSREWIEGVLLQYDEVFAPIANAPDYDPEEEIFLHGEMAAFSKDHRDIFQQAENKEDFAALIEFIANEGDIATDIDESLLKRGAEVFNGTITVGETAACSDCHSLAAADAEYGYSVNLTGYASQTWLREFIKNPGGEEFYADHNRMPGYEDKLTERELEMLVQWMTGNYFVAPEVIKGGTGETTATPQKTPAPKEETE